MLNPLGGAELVDLRPLQAEGDTILEIFERGIDLETDILLSPACGPGENLCEELSHKGENITSPIMRRSCGSFRSALSEVRSHLQQLTTHVYEAEPSQFELLLKTAVPKYRSFLPDFLIGFRDSRRSLPRAAR